MDIYNFPGVIYATDGSKGSTEMGASTHTIQQGADAAGWGEVPEEACPVAPNLRHHVWPSKTPSPSRTGPKGACYKASVTNSHAPSFSSSGVFERTTSAGSVNDYIRMWHRGRKASVISKPDVRLSENPDSDDCSAPRHLAWATHSHQQELPGDTRRRREEMVISVSCQRGHSWHEWTVRQSFVHLGLFPGIRRQNDESITFHARQNIVLTSEEITSFYGWRLDGVAFDANGKQCVFLEFTRPMDSVTSWDDGDWAERKELEKNERYGMHLYFINYLSVLNGRPWNCSQANFAVGARVSLKRTQFPGQDRVCLLGVMGSKARDNIPALMVSKTLALSDIILKLFHVSVLRSPEWALSSLLTELAKSQTSAIQLFKNSLAHSAGWQFKKIDHQAALPWISALQKGRSIHCRPSIACPHVGRSI